MHGRRLVAALVGVALLVTSASAQFNVVEKNGNRNMVGNSQAGIYRADSTARLLTTDTDGNLKTVEQYPPQSYQLIQPSVLSTNFLHITGAPVSGVVISDSCAAINVQGYNRLALLVYPTADDSTWAATVALRWQLHSSALADSQSTYLEAPWNRFRGISSVGVDSMVVRPDSIGTLMPRERNLINASGGPLVAANDSLAMLGENVLVINDISTNHRGRIIYLTNKDGQPVSGAYISLYWRHLNTYNNAFTAFGNLTEPRLRLRADLIGWR